MSEQCNKKQIKIELKIIRHGYGYGYHSTEVLENLKNSAQAKIKSALANTHPSHGIRESLSAQDVSLTPRELTLLSKLLDRVSVALPETPESSYDKSHWPAEKK